ncbi:MAG: hypothetical protein KAY24_19950 [Candidatus Eisenbacteria sp.]|nr:hypothetical protein [Candidatus Eisenbacteria bacterium]
MTKKKTVRVIKREESNSDGRLNLRIPLELKIWAMDYADRNSTTVTQIVTNYFTRLRAADEDRLAADAEQL